MHHPRTPAPDTTQPLTAVQEDDEQDENAPDGDTNESRTDADATVGQTSPEHEGVPRIRMNRPMPVLSEGVTGWVGDWVGG